MLKQHVCVLPCAGVGSKRNPRYPWADDRSLRCFIVVFPTVVYQLRHANIEYIFALKAYLKQIACKSFWYCSCFVIKRPIVRLQLELLVLRTASAVAVTKSHRLLASPEPNSLQSQDSIAINVSRETEPRSSLDLGVGQHHSQPARGTTQTRHGTTQHEQKGRAGSGLRAGHDGCHGTTRSVGRAWAGLAR